MTPASLDVSAKCASGWLLAVDPGLLHPAAAAFHRGELVAASRVKVPGRFASLDRGERVRQIVELIARWWQDVTRPVAYPIPPVAIPPVAVVGEFPKWYSDRRKSKNSADQLFPLAAMSAGVAIRFGVESITPLPSEWIGQIPKDDEAPADQAWLSPRGKLIKHCLREHEIPRVVLSHDAVDSVGLGLWALGRLNGHGGVGPRRYPGAV